MLPRWLRGEVSVRLGWGRIQPERDGRREQRRGVCVRVDDGRPCDGVVLRTRERAQGPDRGQEHRRPEQVEGHRHQDGGVPEMPGVVQADADDRQHGVLRGLGGDHV